MSILSMLTVLFIALKICGVIDWSWFLVILPFIVQILFVFLLVCCKVILEFKGE